MGFNFNLLDGLEFLMFPLDAVRFLLSKKHRGVRREQWRQQSQIKTRRDQIGLIFGFLFATILVVLIVAFSL